MTEAALGLGTNLGDRFANLREAIERLCDVPEITLLKASSVWETPPWGVTDQPAFLNSAILIETSLRPEDLLDVCLAVETQMGRVRTQKWGTRLIDIDINWYGDLELKTERLSLPQRYLEERAFALAPLNELAPDKMIRGQRISGLLERLDLSALVCMTTL